METKFNSQICTSREQSKALLALGLKKETADCHWSNVRTIFNREWLLVPITIQAYTETEIPTWSLHRLVCLCFNSGATHVELFEDDDTYEILIYEIEWLIKEGHFNKEYLVNQAEIENYDRLLAERQERLKEIREMKTKDKQL